MFPDDLNPPVRLMAQFMALHPGCAPELLYRAPDHAVWIAACLSADNRFTLACLEAEAAPVTFTLQSAKQKRTVSGRPLPRWARFPAGILVALSAAGIDPQPISGVVCSDEPVGPRYDYALGLAFAALWGRDGETALPPAHLHAVADRVQRQYVEAGS